MDFCLITKFHYTFFYTRLHNLSENEEKAFFTTLPPLFQTTALGFRQDKDRKAYLAGRWLLRHCLPAWDWAQLRTDDYGKPYLSDLPIHFNLSHSGDWVGLVVSTKNPVGVDIEAVRPIAIDNFESCFSSKEWQNIANAPTPLLAFYHAWTQKESIIKADGRGLSIELQDVVLQKNEGYIADTLPICYQCEFINIASDVVVCVSYPKR